MAVGRRESLSPCHLSTHATQQFKTEITELAVLRQLLMRPARH